MASWSKLLSEASKLANPLEYLDLKRTELLKSISDKTQRNVITYYSAWLTKPGIANLDIGDGDKNAFMQAIYQMDKTKGLDLILHTPGGDIAAAESIVDYLHLVFGDDIRAIVPQMAMSAGTMIALSAKEIIMGKQSNLGPIDPQFGGMSCAGILEEFNTALKDVSQNPAHKDLWGLIIGKYHPTFLGDCKKAIEWSETMVKDWLLDNMFFDDVNKDSSVDKIVSALSSHSETYSHQKHIHIDELRNLGLKVIPLENLDNRKIGGCKDLQDCVLTLHHAYMQTLANSNAIKIIENQKADGLMITVSMKNL